MEFKDLQQKNKVFIQEIEDLKQTLGIVSKQEKLAVLDKEMSLPGFWDNTQAAQKVTNIHAQLNKEVKQWNDLFVGAEELELVLEMLASDYDEQEFQTSLKNYEQLHSVFDELSLSLLYSEPLDDANCFVDLHSGEGGVDAQDFTQILMRMYTRWAEANGYSIEVLSYQSGDEAGAKSATLYIKGPYAFGKLKAEIGVHRLVRLSPFDTAKRRHTSFASINVIPEIDDSIEITLVDSELKIDTYRSSGAGGQSVNTTDSAVRITHLPTGIVVTCQNERSQIQNREQAMKILKSKLYEYALEKQLSEKQQASHEKKGIGFGSQIRSYVMHPYQMVKDHRTNYEVGNIQDVLDGNINEFINSYLTMLLHEKTD